MQTFSMPNLEKNAVSKQVQKAYLARLRKFIRCAQCLSTTISHRYEEYSVTALAVCLL